MMQLLDFFISEGYQVTFATTAIETQVMADLPSLGIKTIKIELNNPSFDSFISGLKPEVVLFDRFMMEEQFGWRVSEVCPRAIRILDTEDLHFFRKARQEAFKKNLELTTELLQSDTAKREIASIYRCDLSLIISKAEIELLKHSFGVPENVLFYLPFMEDTPSEEEKENQLLFEDRKNFISMGNFRHEPNWDAVLNLKENIWPLIRKKLPEAELHIYGAYPGPKVKQLQNIREGFIVKGWADSAPEVIGSSRVLLAPLRFGAGLKGKFIDAMKAGTPTVTTGIGAEGMSDDIDWNGSIADSPEEFAREAIELYTNKLKWENSRARGFELLENGFSKRKFRASFREKLLTLRENLKKHRESNFTGNMLKHHQMAGTKFMSKYIEMKNLLEQARLNK